MTAKFIYDVIDSPVVTEKATVLSDKYVYVFKVAKSATKKAVAKAVEKMFNTSVVKVTILNNKPKLKRFKGNIGVRSAFKKAFVRLDKGYKIDVSVGIK